MFTSKLSISSVAARMNSKNMQLLKVLAEDIYLVTKNNQKENLFIFSERFNFCISVRPGGYIPRSGFLLLDSLKKYNFSGKSVIDIGCGETGLLAHYLHARNAAKVTGVDIDEAAIKHVKNCSLQSSSINWLQRDLFCNINEKFDVIISNPPQMPTPLEKQTELNDFHDSPGISGREVVVRIISNAQKFLNTNGSIFMLVFDFIGVKKSYNNMPSIEEMASKHGFATEIIKSYQRIVRSGGQTEKNIFWIKNIYPDYVFETNEDKNLFYNVHVVRLKTN